MPSSIAAGCGASSPSGASAALVVVLLAVVGLIVALTPGGHLLPQPGYIARLHIKGLIRDNEKRVDALAKLAKSKAARAVIVHINSPGGTTAGSQQLYDSLRALQAKKPTVVVVDGLAASGAYIAALSCDHIIAEDTSLVGSIGVLFQYPNFAEALKTLGIKVESIKSTPLKAAPNGFEPTSPEARAAIQAIVLDSYAWFKNLVKTRRNMTDAQLAAVDDGRVFTGRQALAAKADRWPRQREDRACLAGKGEKGAGKSSGAGLCAGAALQRAFIPACGGLDLRRDRPLGHGAPAGRLGRGAGGGETKS